VYFGPDPNVMFNDFVTNVTAKEVDPATILGEPLHFDTTYYWSVQIIGDPNSLANLEIYHGAAVPVATQEPADVWSVAGGSATFHFGRRSGRRPATGAGFPMVLRTNEPPVVKLVDGAIFPGPHRIP